MIEEVEKRAPGFRGTIQGIAVRTPEQMAAELRWPGAHPTAIDITLDQLGWMRPTKELGGHATPVRGLFISGAGTAPVAGVAGIAGSPGRAAAKALLARQRRQGPSHRLGYGHELVESLRGKAPVGGLDERPRGGGLRCVSGPASR